MIYQKVLFAKAFYVITVLKGYFAIEDENNEIEEISGGASAPFIRMLVDTERTTTIRI